MNFDFSESEEAFRKEVRGWLEANLPDDLRGRAFAASRADRDEVRRLRAWQKRMCEAGYVGLDWPVQGRDAPPREPNGSFSLVRSSCSSRAGTE